MEQMKTYFDILSNVCVQSGFLRPNRWDDLIELHHDQMKQAVNHVLLDICSYNTDRWKFLEKTETYTTVVGQRAYVLPDGFKRVIDVYIPTPANDPKHLKLTRNIALMRTQTNSGVPEYYCRDGNNLLINPPNAEYTVYLDYLTRFYVNVCNQDGTVINERTYLMAEFDEPKIPEEYRKTIVYGACRNMFHPDNPEYSKFDNFYKEALYDMSAEIRDSQADNPAIRINNPKTNAISEAIKHIRSRAW